MLKIKLSVILAIMMVTQVASANNYKYSYLNEDRHNLLVKMRLHYSYLNTSSKNFVATDSEETSDSFGNHGLGGETAVTYFKNRRIAAELSAGASFLFIDQDKIEKIRTNLDLGNDESDDEEDQDSSTSQLYCIPVIATIQYHVAPYGGIRPYIGAGYQVAFFYNRQLAMEMEYSHGLVAQAGVNFILQDDTVINLDIRKSFFNSVASLKPADNVTSQAVNSVLELDPWTISLGIGFKF